MAIGFTAELSHYPSAGRYATQATIPAPAAHDSPALAAATPTIAAHDSPATVAGPAGSVGPCKGVVCPPGQHCMVWPGLAPGTTVARCVETTISCSPGLIACLGYDGTHYCADLKTDPNNCGYCGNECGSNQPCNNGNCECQSGLTMCGTVCTDLSYDPNNCGSCNHSCGPNETCCARNCTDTSTDPNNCGVCGFGCVTGTTCVNGSCTCSGPSPRASNQNYVLANNCEEGILTGVEPWCLPSSSCQALGANNDGVNGWLTVSFVADDLALPTGWSCLSDKSENPAACPTPSCPNPVTVGGHTGCCPVTNGFTLQLNAFPAPTAGVNFMQFVVLYGGSAGNQVVPQVQYWTPGATNPVDGGWGWQPGRGFSLGSVTSTLDETLNIQLNTDSSGNVFSADFQMGSRSQTISIPQQYQLPIYAFEVDVVGPDNCSYAEFTTGSAVLNYSMYSESSNQLLCLQSGIPKCAQGGQPPTAETSNLKYGVMEQCCGYIINGQNVNP
jgi:hypothetical protein